MLTLGDFTIVRGSNWQTLYCGRPLGSLTFEGTYRVRPMFRSHAEPVTREHTLDDYIEWLRAILRIAQDGLALELRRVLETYRLDHPRRAKEKTT